MMLVRGTSRQTHMSREVLPGAFHGRARITTLQTTSLRIRLLLVSRTGVEFRGLFQAQIASEYDGLLLQKISILQMGMVGGK